MSNKIRTRRSHQQVIEGHVDEILDDLFSEQIEKELISDAVNENLQDWEYDIPVIEQAKRAKEQAQWMCGTRVHLSS